MEELFSLLQELKEKVLPSCFTKKTEIMKEITQNHKNIVILGKNYYSLIYAIFWKTPENMKFSVHKIMNTILIEENSNIQSIDPLPTQIMINVLHSLYQQPRPFVLALIQYGMNEAEACQFSYTIFPALFNYFTSKEMYEAGSVFILDMLMANADDFIIKQIVCSFMFSAYSFIDVLWCSFARKYENYGFPDDHIVHETILSSIEKSTPLIPSSLYFVLRELDSRNRQLLYSIIFTLFLPNSFLLWATRSPYGLSLNSLRLVSNYFERNKDIMCERGLQILNAFLMKSNYRISLIPSYLQQCNITCEFMIFCKKDIDIFCKVFNSISNKITMFNELKEFVYNSNDSLSLLTPFSISFFHTQFSLQYKLQREKFKNTLIRIPDIDTRQFYEKDSFMESIYQQYITKGLQICKSNAFYLESEQFIKYKTIKQIEHMLSASEIQEEVILLKETLNDIKDFYMSIKRLHNYILGWFIQENLLPAMAIKQVQYDHIEQLTKMIIGKHESYRITTFIELLDLIEIDNYKIDSKIIQNIIRKVLTSKNDEGFEIIRESDIMTGFPIMLTNRPVLRAGQFFVVMNFIAESIIGITKSQTGEICKNCSRNTIMKFVLRMSNCERVIKYFLFFEKIVFRSSFVKYLPQKIMNNFNFFFQSMWELIKNDTELLKQIISLDLVYNP